MRTLRERLRDYHQGKPSPSAAEPPDVSRCGEMPGFVWMENDWGKYLLGRKVYSLETGEGLYRLGDLYEENVKGLELITRQRIESVGVEDLLFFDTETTGLGTGAGTTIFLYGLGYFREGSFILEQFFLPELSQEPALLADFAKKLEGFKVIVSYNGKGYDWSLVNTRFSLNRLPLPDHLIHGDLLHSARKLWKRRLASCRLQEVEAHCLLIRREGDIQGSLAPEFYFEFLRSRQYQLLEGVFRHNRLDILSLVHLLTHLLRCLGGHADHIHASEKLALGKWFLEAGDVEQGIEWLEKALEDRNLARSLRGEAYRLLAERWKRTKEWEKAVNCWKRWTGESGWDITPFVELAKYYEHHAGNGERALDFTRQAMDVLLNKKMIRRSALIGKQMEELKHRESRLLEKQRKKAPYLELFDSLD
ncbi:ribonuclease H-like domain-containing protein [Lihuaxuella thermophila]|uniref:YprB ribonuclease H-like domain-containing protein n=1 Tax=Lihuaxuella thermophila TaxID=1173111 RepID=A0A1H8EWZ7_9BACL|nr:ribonuclease H-like domain-containing protein [Lihuaxuella thermophila]SEN23979.1 hypothetical protein SAMN05444955_107216 [Lihuaxuella thermophila]